MTNEELHAMKYKICCPICDNYKCVRGTAKCEAELWKKWRMRQMENEFSNEEAVEQVKLLKALTGYDKDNPIVQKMQSALDMAIKALESQETAHFVGHENPNYSPFDDSPKILLLCSECGSAVLSLFNYCPMCGRKFEESDKNE